jgi:hypothetical protein
MLLHIGLDGRYSWDEQTRQWVPIPPAVWNPAPPRHSALWSVFSMGMLPVVDETPASSAPSAVRLEPESAHALHPAAVVAAHQGHPRHPRRPRRHRLRRRGLGQSQQLARRPTAVVKRGARGWTNPLLLAG